MLRRNGFRENRLASLRVRLASLRTGFFLLLVQVAIDTFSQATIRGVLHGRHPCLPLSRLKAASTLTPAVTRASCARDSASALRGLPTAHPALTANSARSIAPTLRAFSTRARRGQEGTWKSQSAAFLAAEAKAFRLARRSGFSRDASALRGIAKKSIAAEAAPTTAALASARRSALLSAFPGPFSGGERRTTKPAGARARCARVRRQRTDALSANLGRRSRTFRAGCAEGDDAGLPFLLVPFLWASKEKKPAHRDAGRTRMDASRFSRKRKNPKQKLDSSLRWNDEHKEQHHPHPTLPLKGRAKAHGYQWFFARTLKNTMDSGLRWNDDIKTHRGAPR